MTASVRRLNYGNVTRSGTQTNKLKKKIFLKTNKLQNSKTRKKNDAAINMSYQSTNEENLPYLDYIKNEKSEQLCLFYFKIIYPSFRHGNY